jgi:hypothetical protein
MKEGPIEKIVGNAVKLAVPVGFEATIALAKSVHNGIKPVVEDVFTRLRGDISREAADRKIRIRKAWTNYKRLRMA